MSLSDYEEIHTPRQRAISTKPSVELLREITDCDHVLVFDLDGVLCEEGKDHTDYADRKPVISAISIYLLAHDLGWRTIIHTARYEEDREVTVKWLRERGRIGAATYALVMDKPRATHIVDDRSLDLNALLQAVRSRGLIG